MDDISISPDQFIFENFEDIKKTYSFKEKIGEGILEIIKGGFGVVYKGISN